MSDTRDSQHVSLDYYARQQCSRQWRDFLRVFFEELFSSAGEDDARAFLRHIGTRMAKTLPLAEGETVEALEAAINALWRDMDWGWARLTARERSLHIVHGACPVPAGDKHDAARGLHAMAALLEGLYAGWLEAQGGEANVPLRAVEVTPGQPLAFVYGHAAPEAS